jgi:hypothetical protein
MECDVRATRIATDAIVAIATDAVAAQVGAMDVSEKRSAAEF